MISRVVDYDRLYRRHMALAVPLSTLLCVVLILSLPRGLVPSQEPGEVGYSGPLKVLPEVDIREEEIAEEQSTAAPRGAPPADFVAVEFDVAEAPAAEPIPTPSTPADVEEATTPESSERNGLQSARRTTAHPVLGETEYELLYMERPVYPREALQVGLEGDVEIFMLIDVRGRVSQASVVQAGRIPILERAARDALAKSVFRPYLVDGRPTPFWVRVPIQFRISN